MINLKFKTIALLMMFVCTVSASDMVPLIGGKISDIDSGESLPFAKVQIKDTTRIATANQDGSFTIFNIPVGSILIITKMGYENEQIKVRSGDKRLIVNLVKLEKDNFIEEVVVTGAASSSMMQQSGISQFSLSPELTSSLPNLGEQDIFRSMQLLPGVSGSNESSSGLLVRGGTIDQNLVLFDDYTVYHVDHVFGFFSAFNNNAIKDVQFYKGGFGAKYGGRMSSVVDITGKDGNTEKFNIGGNVSLLSTNALIEAPFADGAGSFILTGRQSYQSDLYDDILESVTGEDQNAQAGTSTPGQFVLGRFAIEPESYFYDLNAKLTYRLPNDNKFSLSFYNGADELDNSRNIDGNANIERLCELFNGNGPFGGQYSSYCEEEISFAVDTIDL
ncbi:MAG: TonB-dependent receptor, partial [Gammaproteobacteria bacterium]